MLDEDDFIQWCIEKLPDPWSTMANDYILWGKKDRGIFEDLWEELGERYKSERKPVNIPQTIVLVKTDGTEIKLKARTNYSFARLLQRYLEETKQSQTEGSYFADWLETNNYYERTN